MIKTSKYLTRTIRIHKEDVIYKLRYSKRAKYLRLQINYGSELELILPSGCGLKEAEKFLRKKANWVKKHLYHKPDQVCAFLFMGQELKVQHDYELFITKHRVSLESDKMIIKSPKGSLLNDEFIYDKWLKQIAKTYLIQRAFALSKKFNIEINKISIRGQKTRWGSCSLKGNLSFNYKLMKYEKEVIDYVIIHELCHRKEMNHSQKFWALVARYCPEYKQFKKELKGELC